MIVLFGIGTLWFWVFLTIVTVCIITVQENSEYAGSWSTFGVILTFLGLYFLGAKASVEDLGWHIYHNPLHALCYFVLYTLAGTLWSFYKWGGVVTNGVESYKKEFARYVRVSELESNYRRPDKPLIDSYKPKLSEHKGDLFNWIFYWPFSFTWFCIHKPMETIFEEIMKVAKKIYESITDRAFDKAQESIDGTKGTDMVQ